MKVVVNGAGIDNTANAKLWLLQNRNMYIQDLYQIGPVVFTGSPPNNPPGPSFVPPGWVSAPILYQWTDADYPIKSTYLGSTFYPERIKRGSLTYKIGMAASSLTFDLYTQDTQQPYPGGPGALGNVSGDPGYINPYPGETANPIQGPRGYPPYEDPSMTYKPGNQPGNGWGLASTLKVAFTQGDMDGLPFTMYRAFMPTPGDADTIGIAQIFAGYISKSEITRSKVTVTVDSLMQVFQTKVPTQLIEPGDRGWSYIPRSKWDASFTVLGNVSTTSVILLNFQDNFGQQPNYGGDGSDFNDGWALYTYQPWQGDVAPWETLRWNAYYSRRIRKMSLVNVDGTRYQVELYEPLPMQPWRLGSEGDQIFLWKKAGIANGSSPYGPGFPYVPPAEAAV